jgi:membrane protease YdiL (CAAX protease family)
MDTDIALATNPAGPPPLPYSVAPPLPESPSGWAAVGMLVLYFLLQAFVGGAIAAVIGLGIFLVDHGQPVTEIMQTIKASMARPNINVLLVAGALGGATAIMWWLVRHRWPQLWRRAAVPGFGLAAPRDTSFYAIAVAAGIALPIIGGILTQFLAQGHQVPQDIKQLGAHASLAAKLVLMVVAIAVAPVIEELLFRGVLLSAWLKRLNVGWAVACTSLTFALVHLPDLKFLWYGLPNLAMLGAAFAWLRLKSNSLWPAVIAHGVNNLVTTLAWFFAMQSAG